MTNQERLVRSESIIRRQNTGKLSKWDASAEFDRLLDDCGDLHFYSDTTAMRADWDGRVMLFPTEESDTSAPGKATPGNTGIITQGPNRGSIVTKPGEVRDCHLDTLAHFEDLAARALTERGNP